MHAPDAFQAIAEELNAIEQGRTWPEALLPWNQTHAQKPHKEMGVLDSMRPISVAPIIYRSWSVRVRQLREHIAHMVPAEQHGAIHKRGVHTALLRMLAFLERDKQHLGQPLRFSTLTASDLLRCFVLHALH